eukprot:gnl/TRDRNA2_/TRDRNA2_138946_c1_seq1.p1 gnl/TRDRNA2_/TRDRNA2_138946_c1~~gnl/TRDRNA2_/TRDRNA2_138946_c1_seq1.p1  ORF type:complete len:428 (-),score=78.97 gnl/TRDRNA2_/TRDRNA2_138946_c1_seq1:38-1279(-)
MYEDKVYGKKRVPKTKQGAAGDASRNPTVRILDPRVIAHGASFFWMRWHRLAGLEAPPVAHANFGKHKLYFLRDRGVWFAENFTARFLEPSVNDEYYPSFELPDGFFMPGEANTFAGASESGHSPKFLRYRHTPRQHATEDRKAAVAADFLTFASAVEVSIALGRRLVLPNAFDCTRHPAYVPYRLAETFETAERKSCTFDYFADSERFVKRFDSFTVESAFVHSDYFKALTSATVDLRKVLHALPAESNSDRSLASLAALRRQLQEEEGWPDVVEIGGSEQDDGDDIIQLRDLLREKLAGLTPLTRKLWQCRWIDFDGWYFALRPGQEPPRGESACGVHGLDCCGVYHGWSEKLEYFTGVPWDLPCDCGVGEALGCTARSGGECLQVGQAVAGHDVGAAGLAEDIRRSFEEL